MLVFPLYTPLLLMCVWTGNPMCNANGLKESVEFMVFPSPLSLNTFNFGIQLVFHRGLKIKKPNHNIIFTLKKKNPSKMTETAYINE
jgi:hypothetical protein